MAEYRDGAVTGEDRKALVVDPDVLRSVLAGAWSSGGSPLSVEGCDARPVPPRVERGGRPRHGGGRSRRGGVRSMDLSGAAGHLLVDYTGEAQLRGRRRSRCATMNSGRHLSLKLVAVEPIRAAGSAGR